MLREIRDTVQVEGEAPRRWFFSRAPLLEPDGVFPAKTVLRRFLELSGEMPQEIVTFVAQRLREHPQFREDIP